MVWNSLIKREQEYIHYCYPEDKTDTGIMQAAKFTNMVSGLLIAVVIRSLTVALPGEPQKNYPIIRHNPRFID